MKNEAMFVYRLVPRLKYIIKESAQPELRLLRGKTIECISLIGLAVGSEKVFIYHQNKSWLWNLLCVQIVSPC